MKKYFSIFFHIFQYPIFIPTYVNSPDNGYSVGLYNRWTKECWYWDWTADEWEWRYLENGTPSEYLFDFLKNNDKV